MNCKIIFLLFVSIVFLNAHGHKNFGQKLFGKVKTEIKQIIKSMGELVQHSEHNAHNLRDDSKNKNARFLIGGFFDTTLSFNWNSTFLQLVTDNNFPFDNMMKSFYALAECKFNLEDPQQIEIIKNSSASIQYCLSSLLNSSFNGSNPSSSKYETIYKQLVRSVNHYEPSNFLNFVKNLSSSINFHNEFSNIKLWIQKDIQQAGQSWGKIEAKFNGLNEIRGEHDQLTNCTFDESAKKFFFGFVTEQLQRNWSQSILSIVNFTNFNYSAILENLEILSRNTNSSRSEPEFQHAIYEIFDILQKALYMIFPRNFVPSDEANIYELIYNASALYKDAGSFARKIDKNVNNTNFTEILEKVQLSMKRGASNAGFLWAKFNRIVNGNPSHIRNETEDHYARKFVKGFVKEFLHKFDKKILKKIDAEVFDYKLFLENLNTLSHNSFNFSNNQTDEESFVETVGVMSRQLLQLRETLNCTHDHRLRHILNVTYFLFASHERLYQTIIKALHHKVDIRYYFEKTYDTARYFGDFKKAGHLFGESVLVLFRGNNSTVTEDLTNSTRKFLHGFLSYYLKENWNSTILGLLNDQDFNLAGFNSNFILLQEMELRNNSEISMIMSKLINEIQKIVEKLFPLVGYAYRYGITIRAINPNHSNIYEVFNKTITYYEKFIKYEAIKNFSAEAKENLDQLLINYESEDEETQGRLFASFNEKLHWLEVETGKKSVEVLFGAN